MCEGVKALLGKVFGTLPSNIHPEWERGGSEEPMVLFESFAGRRPDNTAFLKGRGLIEE